MGVSLEVTLPTNFRLRALGEKRCVLSDFGQLIAIRCFLHDRVAIDATNSPARMRARIPVSLNSALVACKACLVLKSDRFASVLAKRNHSANAFSATGCDVVAAGPVAVLASLFLSFVARIKEKNFPHQRLGKFFKLRGVAGLADFAADVGSRRGFGRFFFR